MHILIVWGDDIDLVTPEDEICVIFDVLRASTTISTMLSKNARRVYITTSVEETLARKWDDANVLACGERNGYPPEGFDHGNSPVEFLDLDLENKDVVLTTSNFTRIADKVIKKGFKEIYSGALVHLKSMAVHVLERARNDGRDIILVPAGMKTKAYEDLVGVKYFLKELLKVDGQVTFKSIKIDPDELNRENIEKLDESSKYIYDIVVQNSKHAQYLLKEGFRRDVEFALQLDYFKDNRPVYEPSIQAFTNHA
ncbi:MAG: 2-phosphosulfolactate phosphatase [Candidatus Hodarchaeota archaeon]